MNVFKGEVQIFVETGKGEGFGSQRTSLKAVYLSLIYRCADPFLALVLDPLLTWSCGWNLRADKGVWLLPARHLGASRGWWCTTPATALDSRTHCVHVKQWTKFHGRGKAWKSRKHTCCCCWANKLLVNIVSFLLWGSQRCIIGFLASCYLLTPEVGVADAYGERGYFSDWMDWLITLQPL